MKTADADILVVPGWSGSGPDHWQTRWAGRLKTARRVEQDDWLEPDCEAWTGRIISELAASTRPVILVAHSLGVIAAVHTLVRVPDALVAAAFLVAPADIENALSWPVTEGRTFNPASGGFAPIPRSRLHCPSLLIASTDDPYCSLERARAFAADWGASLVEAGPVGHINAASGHGPWPEGLMQFGLFLSRIGDPQPRPQ